MKKTAVLAFIILILLTPKVGNTCDDTLVMLLTAKNPTSEFSKVIRSFTTNLTELGLALKYGNKTDYKDELENVMNSWLDFTTRYMTNPPEEARNDINWIDKMHQTSRAIGSIRKLVKKGEYLKAHNNVLELSGRIGMFFEAVGISDEKQLFIETSRNVTVLEQMALSNEKEKALISVASLSLNLKQFSPLIPEEAQKSASLLGEKLEKLETELTRHKDIALLDPKILEIKAIFEELRSHILMKEWFPETSPEN
jgi:uncharacterized membrane protein